MGNSLGSINDSEWKIRLKCIDKKSKALIHGYIRQNTVNNIPIEIINICILFYTQYNKSKMLTNKEWSSLMDILSQQKLNEQDNDNNVVKLELLYESNNDKQFVRTRKMFHDKCDDKGATVIIVRSQFNHIFGGYSSISWHAEQKWSYKKDRYAFLFLLRTQFHTEIPKICKLINSDDIHAIHHYGQQNGPAFGMNHSLIIDSVSNTYVNTGGTEYDFVGNELCGGTEYNEQAAYYKFKAEQWEVFQVINKVK